MTGARATRSTSSAPACSTPRSSAPPTPHARVTSVDVSAVPGDCVVLAPADVADLGRYGCQVARPARARRRRPVRRRRRRRGRRPDARGGPRRGRARRGRVRGAAGGLRRGRGGRRPTPCSLHPDAAASAEEAVSIGVRPVPGTNVCHRFRLVSGDVAAGFAEADVVVEETFRTPSAAHAPMEPHAALAEWDDGRLTVWAGTQTPFNTARRPRRPVRPRSGARCAWSRRRWAARSGPRPSSAPRPSSRRSRAAPGGRSRSSSTAPRSSSRSTATRPRSASGSGARATARSSPRRSTAGSTPAPTPTAGPGVATKLGYAGVGPYRIPHVRVEARAIYTNLPPNGAYRGYGAMQSVWASERTMDLLAERLGHEPARPAAPEPAARRRPLRHRRGHARRALRRVPAGRRRRHRLRGRTRAARAWASCSRGCRRRAAPRSPSSARPVGYVVRSARLRDGPGRAPLAAALAAELLGCEPGQVELPDPDTDTSPFDTRTTSSRSTHMMGRALVEAVRDLRSDGGERGFGEVRDEGGLDPDTGQGIASTHWHQGAAGARVSVDEETGRVTVEHLHGVAYAGRVVDRAGAELQNEGSLDDGPRDGAVRGDRLLRRTGWKLQPLRLPRARPRRPAGAAHARAHRARRRGGPRPRRDRRSRRSPPRSATRCTRSALHAPRPAA